MDSLGWLSELLFSDPRTALDWLSELLFSQIGYLGDPWTALDWLHTSGAILYQLGTHPLTSAGVWISLHEPCVSCTECAEINICV